jgi:hypothetical protein
MKGPFHTAIDREEHGTLYLLLLKNREDLTAKISLEDYEVPYWYRTYLPSVVEYAIERDSTSAHILLANCRLSPLRYTNIGWVLEYIQYVSHCRESVRILLALKRRRIHSMRNLDRFLVRVLAVQIYAERYTIC